MDFDVDETEDIDLMEIQIGKNKVSMAGFARGSGTVYLDGDLHVQGSFPCLMIAAKEHVPYVYTSAVSAMFPADWLRGQCMHDPDRLRILNNLERFVRGQ